jgi:uncharacterized membrane protein
MTAEIFGPSFAGFGGAYLLMVVAFWALPIAALVSVASLSRVAFYQAHSSKTAWIVILAIGILLSPVGFFFALYFFLLVRRRVRRFDPSADT